MRICGRLQIKRLAITLQEIAPRSANQFKVGPPFESTTLLKPIILSPSLKKVHPLVTARIDRGFDLIDNEWIGYKRNYFTLVAAFEFKNYDLDIVCRLLFSTIDESGKTVGIRYFAIQLKSKCYEEETEIGLVQHTAKRDRGPQNPPPIFNAIPGILPSHQVIKQSSNIRNEDKISSFHRVFYLDIENMKCSASSILKTYPTDLPVASVSRYERIQFSAAITNKKSANANGRFILRVVLLGVLENGKTEELAHTESRPLTIRGRSPSNYPKPMNPNRDINAHGTQLSKEDKAPGGCVTALSIFQFLQR
ncbi:DNA binding transcription factor [Suhomyces tanzawaensis NRRL Y-17324]|uniref:DNA binding transcription factor n=1 Tax=Suhomyces tanzawaensis NRRL Y-17324 TaxID=984487 RepID=A0A1E4SKM7_9ASCO|nr:DNA binding transcription factor [Suhomyces tanzawaensis NRRL Y-17324]ODV79982.1 DNA binding transcription factor [Suhomyces tanzawaensis NRRL Y-17324]